MASRTSQESFSSLLKEIRACQVCAYHLRLPPKPVIQAHAAARLLIIAQAPGARARASGLPFDDPSGDRLRRWLGIDRSVFYDETRIALMPMGFCYPGSSAGGDLPPCKDCAPLWHPQVLPYLSKIRLTLLVGSYAQRYYLKGPSMTEAVKNWRAHLPKLLPLPHPSWHNNAWIKQNPWFENELLPVLKRRVKQII